MGAGFARRNRSRRRLQTISGDIVAAVWSRPVLLVNLVLVGGAGGPSESAVLPRRGIETRSKGPRICVNERSGLLKARGFPRRHFSIGKRSTDFRDGIFPRNGRSRISATKFSRRNIGRGFPLLRFFAGTGVPDFRDADFSPKSWSRFCPAAFFYRAWRPGFPWSRFLARRGVADLRSRSLRALHALRGGLPESMLPDRVRSLAGRIERDTRHGGWLGVSWR